MKKSVLFMFLLAIIHLATVAQDINQKIHEVGISLDGPGRFGVRYRSGSENKLFRLTVLSISGGQNYYRSNSDPTSMNGNYGFGFNTGIEKRKIISDCLRFYYGSEILLAYGGNKSDDPTWSHSSKNRNVSGGLGIVLGFVYEINKDINISAEIVPSIEYSYGKSTNVNNGVTTTHINKGFVYGLTNSVGNLTLAFRLGKKN